MRRTKRNTLPVASFSLRELGPTSVKTLTERVGFFRYAHGKGTDKRATVDALPCPHCAGKVEWALTYRREGERADGRPKFTPYIYARCRTAPKSHRWDFTHWQAPKKAHTELPPRPGIVKGEIPTPRASIGAGTRTVTTWIDQRLETLSAEVEKLAKIRQLAAEVAALGGTFVPPPALTAAPKGDVEPNGTPPGVQHTAHRAHHN